MAHQFIQIDLTFLREFFLNHSVCEFVNPVTEATQTFESMLKNVKVCKTYVYAALEHFRISYL